MQHDHREDLATLRLFNEKVERLQSSRLGRRLAETEPEVVVKLQGPVDTQASGAEISITGNVIAHLTEHDQDDIDAFVLTYRMFIQKNDRVSRVSLRRIYGEKWMPAEAAQNFREADEEVDKYLNSPISISVEEELISRSNLVDIIIYGGLSHTNAKKEQIYRSWTTDGAAGFFWVEFVVTMRDMLGYLSFFRDLNNAVLANCSG